MGKRKRVVKGNIGEEGDVKREKRKTGDCKVIGSTGKRATRSSTRATLEAAKNRGKRAPSVKIIDKGESDKDDVIPTARPDFAKEKDIQGRHPVKSKDKGKSPKAKPLTTFGTDSESDFTERDTKRKLVKRRIYNSDSDTDSEYLKNGGLNEILDASTSDYSSETDDEKEEKLLKPKNYFGVVVVEEGKTYYRSNLKTAVLKIKGLKFTKSHIREIDRMPTRYLFHAINRADRVTLENMCEKNEDDIRSILKCYDLRSQNFIIGGQEVQLTSRDVSLIFGVGGGSKKIPFTKKNSRNAPWVRRNFGELLPSLNKTLILDRMKKLLSKDDETSKQDVARLMHCYLMASILSPSQSSTIALHLTEYLEKVDEVMLYDWSAYVVDILWKQIRTTRNMKIGGCAILLPYWLLEHTKLVVPERKVLFPRFLKWDLNMLTNKLKRRRLKKLPSRYVSKIVIKPTSEEKSAFRDLLPGSMIGSNLPNQKTVSSDGEIAIDSEDSGNEEKNNEPGVSVTTGVFRKSNIVGVIVKQNEFDVGSSSAVNKKFEYYDHLVRSVVPDFEKKRFATPKSSDDCIAVPSFSLNLSQPKTTSINKVAEIVNMVIRDLGSDGAPVEKQAEIGGEASTVPASVILPRDDSEGGLRSELPWEGVLVTDPAGGNIPEVTKPCDPAAEIDCKQPEMGGLGVCDDAVRPPVDNVVNGSIDVFEKEGFYCTQRDTEVSNEIDAVDCMTQATVVISGEERSDCKQPVPVSSGVNLDLLRESMRNKFLLDEIDKVNKAWLLEQKSNEARFRAIERLNSRLIAENESLKSQNFQSAFRTPAQPLRDALTTPVQKVQIQQNLDLSEDDLPTPTQIYADQINLDRIDEITQMHISKLDNSGLKVVPEPEIKAACTQIVPYTSTSTLAKRVKIRTAACDRKRLELTPQLSTAELIGMSERRGIVVEDYEPEVRTKVIKSQVKGPRMDKSYRAVSTLSDDLKAAITELWKRGQESLIVWRGVEPLSEVRMGDIIDLLHHAPTSAKVIDAWVELILKKYERTAGAKKTAIFTSYCWDIITGSNPSEHGSKKHLIDNHIESSLNQDVFLFPLLTKPDGVSHGGLFHWTLLRLNVRDFEWTFFNSMRPRTIGVSDTHLQRAHKVVDYVEGKMQDFYRAKNPDHPFLDNTFSDVTPKCGIQQVDSSVDCGIIVCMQIESTLVKRYGRSKIFSDAMSGDYRRKMVELFIETPSFGV